MDIKEQLCKAFCGSLTVQDVPIGYAVGTEYNGLGDDRIGFYIDRASVAGKYRIIDDAMLVPTLEMLGADVTDNPTRNATFEALLSEYGVTYDKSTDELSAGYFDEQDVPKAAINFLAFMLRVQDVVFMARDRAESTFKQDFIQHLKETIGDHADLIIGQYVVADSLKEFPADIGIIADGHKPYALFFGVSDAKILEAMLLQAYALTEQVPCTVAALVEFDDIIARKTLTRALNHLDGGALVYRDDEQSVVSKIARQSIGYDPKAQTVH